MFGFLISLILLISAGTIYLYISPMPGVFLLRYAFGGEGEVQNPDDYDQIFQNVSIKKDLTYPSEDGRNQYDLYLPRHAENPLPVIVWIHGGAFVAGDKSGVENWAVMLANEGYAVAAMNYEWAPEIKYPGQVRQVEECIKELKNLSSSEQMLDLSNVIIAGDSAGAHIAAQAGLLATNPQYSELIGVESTLTKKELKAMLLYCGPYNVEKILKVDNSFMQFLASRIGWALLGDKHWQEGNMIETTTIKNYITKDYPPTFLSDGNSGSFELEGKELISKLESEGVKTQSLFFDKSLGEIGHEYQFNLSSKQGMQTFTQTIQFLDEIFQK